MAIPSLRAQKVARRILSWQAQRAYSWGLPAHPHRSPQWNTSCAFRTWFKADAETAEEQEKRKEVFAQFEDLTGVEAFESLREHCLEFDLALQLDNDAVLDFRSLALSVVKTQRDKVGGLLRQGSVCPV